MVKLFLIIVLFCLFITAGAVVYLYYLYRYKLYKDLVYISKYLNNNISFNKNEIDLILTNAFVNISQSSKFLLRNYNNTFTRFLCKNDGVCIAEFFQSLGRGDVAFEINNLKYYEKMFMELEDKSKELFNKNGLMYFKLIIGIGLIVCIILI